MLKMQKVIQQRDVNSIVSFGGGGGGGGGRSNGHRGSRTRQVVAIATCSAAAVSTAGIVSVVATPVVGVPIGIIAGAACAAGWALSENVD